uniref:Uncharacterized protein n=1 Tax=viral metagenome TaxID=1070528 RepID=A0A6M3XZR8_9ZZZZ
MATKSNPEGMKFKAGDKVRILPSAVNGGIDVRDIGKVGKITYYNDEYKYFLVKVDKSNYPSWAVYPNQMTLAINPGYQLLLWDDIYEETA